MTDAGFATAVRAAFATSTASLRPDAGSLFPAQLPAGQQASASYGQPRLHANGQQDLRADSALADQANAAGAQTDHANAARPQTDHFEPSDETREDGGNEQPHDQPLRGLDEAQTYGRKGSEIGDAELTQMFGGNATGVRSLLKDRPDLTAADVLQIAHTGNFDSASKLLQTRPDLSPDDLIINDPGEPAQYNPVLLDTHSSQLVNNSQIKPRELYDMQNSLQQRLGPQRGAAAYQQAVLALRIHPETPPAQILQTLTGQ